MQCPNPRAVTAIKVFVKRNQVASVLVVLDDKNVISQKSKSHPLLELLQPWRTRARELIARGARILLARANPARGIEVKRESLKLNGVNDAAYRSQNAHPDVLEALALLEVARAKVEMVKKLDRGEDLEIPAFLRDQSDKLAAAPASPKIRKEIIALEELQRELSEDCAVTRKRASSQVYEKQRGY